MSSTLSSLSLPLARIAPRDVPLPARHAEFIHPLTSGMKELSLVQSRVPEAAYPSPRQLIVQVLVNTDGGTERVAVPVAGTETIRDLNVSLSRGSAWFTSKHCLVFGDRALLDDRQVSHIVDRVNTSGNNAYLHVFMRTRDIKRGTLRTDTSSVSFGNLAQLDDDELASPPALPDAAHAAAPAMSSALEAPAALALRTDALSAVLHIIIRKTAHVTWKADAQGELELSVRAGDKVADLKQQLLPAGQGTAALVKDLDLFHNGVRLQADMPLIECGLRDGDILDLVPWEPTAPSGPRATDAGPPAAPALSSPAHELYANWQRAAIGLKAGVAPDLAPSGTGGSYFLRDTAGAVVAVFKPVDEEPNMPHNPRGFTPGTSPDAGASSLRRGVRPGEGAQREIAAYLLDHGHRAGVPATAPVFLTYPDGSAKHGSLQQYVPSDADCEEMGYSAFPVAEVHKIAVLDLRLANADRNGANILARRAPDGAWCLVPIDHGYCLPDSWEDMSFEWSSWRQARVPFSPDTIAYILGLDPDADLALLQERGITLRPECVRIFKAANMVLKKVAARGLPPTAASDILERNCLRKSDMEKMHRIACNKALLEEEADAVAKMALVPTAGAALRHSSSLGPRSDSLYLKHLGVLLDEYLEGLEEAPLF